MVNFGRLVVIVIVLRLCGMRMIVMTRFIAVIVLLEGAALAEAELHEIVGIDQLYRFRVRANCLQWLFKESLKFVPDPEHDICLLQHLSLRRPESVGMRRARTFNDQAGLTDTFHHRGYQRMNRLDGGHHLHLGAGGSGREWPAESMQGKRP
jgi:hypothetical protein